VRINRQRLPESCARYPARSLKRADRFDLFFALSLLLLAAASLLCALPARADEEVVIDAGGDMLDSDDSGIGMPSSNPRVRPILAAHPGQLVVVCVAGCGKPRAVQVLSRPVAGRIGGLVPSKGKMGSSVYGPPKPGQHFNRLAGIGNDVICVAGCNGRPGQVLQRMSDLPPPAKGKPRAPKKKRDGLLDILP